MAVNVVGAKDNVGTQVVQQSEIQCYNCKEYGHVVREFQKPKRANDAAYHKEKMLLCKQKEVRFQLNTEQADWRNDTNDELEDQELEEHYQYMAQIQEVTPDAADNFGPIFDAELLQKQYVATPFKRTVAAKSTNQKPRSTIRKQYEQISKTCKWWYSKITPPGYEWKPKSSTVNVKANTSMHLGIKPRTTNTSKPTTLRKSTVSNTPLSSNSFAARRDNSVHHRLWVLKAHDRNLKLLRDLVQGNFTIERVYYIEDHFSSDPVPQCSRTTLEQVSLSLGIQSQENVPHAAKTVTMSNELDLLFSLMFDELLNGTTQVVSKSPAITTADAPNQCQQQHTTLSTSTIIVVDTPLLNIQTTPKTTSQAPTQAPTVTPTENINQAKTHKENAQVKEDKFINIFSTPTRDHPLEQVIGNPSQSIRTGCQLEPDGKMCMFALTVSQTEPKNIKEAMANSAWIEAIALMYLTTSRPDIVHATCYCARYQARPTENYLKEVKQILRYLKNTINMGLWYPKDIDFELTAFLDSNHAGCLDSYKSTSGGIQFLGSDKVVSWSSKK
nr:uncharacterized mitochondrial protein AtMg00810-like [Tanacetum cinerariifolium]